VKAGRWLLLVHQLPAGSSRARVKAWRRLQQLGAVAIRNAVYVLPDSPQAREDFEWVKAEILASRGEASVFAADTIDSLTRDDIVAAFRADRERLYKAIGEDARGLAGRFHAARTARGTDRRRLQRTVRQLRDRYEQVVASDFFAAAGRAEVEAALVRLERLAAPGDETPGAPGDGLALHPEDYRGRTWLTRPRPGIDRSGSAWLIRRFIDPAARFTFGDRPGAAPRAIPFDMYGVEFSHHGDHCTFEVLCRRFGVADAAVAHLGRLVHDLDLKESRYNVPEAPAVGRLIDGLRQSFASDGELLEQGMVLFEALYRSYARGVSPAGARRTGRRRA
jgi:hypothetical protein